MDTQPDTIHVTTLHREEISATHANLFVSVRGSSAFSGNEAMKKAREVSALVDELIKTGVSSEDIHLQGVHVETSSGTLLRSSSAIYRLRVRCGKLDALPVLLDVHAQAWLRLSHAGSLHHRSLTKVDRGLLIKSVLGEGVHTQ